MAQCVVSPQKRGKCLDRVLLFGWLTGCFPTRSPFTSSSHFTFSWFAPITVISVCILVFNTALMMDFAVNSIVGYARTTLGSGISAIIAEFGGILYVVLGDAASRLILVTMCGKLTTLMGMIHSQEERRRHYYFGFCIYMYNCVIVIVCSNVLAFTHTMLRMNNYIGFFKPIPDYVNFSLLPPNDLIIRIAFGLQSFLAFASQSFGISLSLILGTNLISLYCSFTNELRALWGQFELNCPEWLNETGEIKLQKFVVKFKDLKGAFGIYSEVVGPLTFVMMVSTGVGFVHAVYSLSTAQALSFIPGTIGCIFWIGFLSYFGNFMEIKINEIREILRNTMMTLPRHCPCKEMNMDELGQVTKWVIDWKWRLTAGNLFSVNNALLPAAVGTSMTYVIFIFQLRMSELQPSTFDTAAAPYNVSLHG